MGIADIALLSVDVTQKQIGGFPSHAGQLQQVIHIVRHLAVEVGKQHLGGQNNVSCLVAVKTAGMDKLFHVRDVSLRKGFQCGVLFKQCRGDHIDPGIGALCRQPDGDHQFIVLAVVQGAGGIRVGFLQC